MARQKSRPRCLALTLALACFSSASVLPYRGATIVTRDVLLQTYDYIVVGAGTAGLTVADRLSESGKYTVLAVEYGYLDTGISIINSGGPFGTLGPPNQTFGREPYPAATRLYNLTSEPMPGINGRQQNMQAGCIVGGSSAVNGMVFGRGSAEDYDAWVLAAGQDNQKEYAAEWGWANLLPFFRKSTTFHEPLKEMADEFGMTSDAKAAYGGDTPIHASFAPFQWPALKVIWNAFKLIPGIEFPKEAADGNATGVFWAPNSIDPSTRTRSYALLGHYSNLGGSSTRSNFHLLTAHRVTQVVLGLPTGEGADSNQDHGGWEAQGVVITPRDGNFSEGPLRIATKREVILSAGAVHTPQILQRSGIGPKDTLQNAHVQVKVELPGVGYNLQDHSAFSMTFNFTKPPSIDSAAVESNETLRAWALNLWDTNRTGPYSVEVNSFAYLPLAVFSNKTQEIVDSLLKQDPAAYLPNNTHPTVVAGFAAQIKVRAQQFLSRRSAAVEIPFIGRAGFAVCNMKSMSRGTVLISPDDDGVGYRGRGNKEPIVTWRSLSNPLDVVMNVEELKFGRMLMASRGMDSLAPVETAPGPTVATEQEMVDWIRDHMGSSNGHMVGTAAMAPRSLGGVVASDLRVHGTRRLSVADNSVVNLIPATHTSSTAYAIGEKAADLILRRAKLDNI